MPEMLWKNYIDFEIDEGEGDNARALYERLLSKTGHVKVWISYSQFEGTEVGKGVDAARDTFKRAHDHMKDAGMKEERVLLLDAWRVFEKTKGDAQSLAKVDAMLPRRVKRKRMRTDEGGAELGWEEYFDYHFPNDEDANAGNLKILEMAAKWKQSQQAQDDSSSSDEDDSSDDE
jgi:crooked neck